MKSILIALLLCFGVSISITGAEGLAIAKVGNIKSTMFAEPKLDAINCRVRWIDVQPTSATLLNVQPLKVCIDKAAANGKVVFVEVNSAAADGGVNSTSTPTWAKAAGVQTVAIPNQTNEFPIWWDAAYKLYWKNLIDLLTATYNGDARVAGYVITGVGGTLGTSLAGSQTDALCTNFQAKGYNGACPADAKGEDASASSGNVYGLAVIELMQYWASKTTKPLVYSAREPMNPLALSGDIDAMVVAYYSQIAVVNSGFAMCERLTDVIARYSALQAAGHIVGWWSIAPNGFPVDADGRILPGEVAAAIYCAGAALDKELLVFGFSDPTWTDADTLNAAYQLFHPAQ